MRPFSRELKTLSSYSLFALIFLLSAPFAGAQATFTTDEAEFNSNNVLIIQDFQDGNVAPGDLKVCGLSTIDSSGDLCFAPGAINPGLVITTFAPILAGVDIGDSQNPFNALISGEGISLNVTFTNGQTLAAGVDVGCLTPLGEDFCSDTIRVSAFGQGGAALGSIDVAATSRFDTFVGVTSTQPIERINVDSTSGFPEFGLPGFDRVSFGRPSISPIPTLSEWGIIAMAGVMGIAGLIAAGIRKARA